MATILDILIQILNIDCSVAQCSGYASEIEAMFYLFLFPTIFIILFIYILTSFIFRGGGKVRGLKMLIAIGVYAFIVFEHMFTSVVAISRLWWLLTIILVGLFAFLRFLFTGGREEGTRGGLPEIAGQAREKIGHLIDKRKIEEPLIRSLGLESDEEREYRKIREKFQKCGENLSKLEPGERAIMQLTMAIAGSGGATPKQLRDLKALLKSESEGETTH
ncbi:MAG: hypothetical protein JSW41_03335 [Candidatus Aenigmatarchaeota archaeon]|nr:MAG: hypothetical protein JSW41_03335 [Candidatus Aenigmarchaeota archaeon]